MTVILFFSYILSGAENPNTSIHVSRTDFVSSNRRMYDFWTVSFSSDMILVPFKTRDGGVMRLEHLISGINEEMLAKIQENQKTKENLGISTEEAENTAKMVALAAIKYGDLSNQASKDYIFDIDRFTSFEGNTGPYILYTIVRIKSILNKYHGS